MVAMVGLRLFPSFWACNPQQYRYQLGAMLRTANGAKTFKIRVAVSLRILAEGAYVDTAVLFGLGVLMVLTIL